MAVDKFSEQFLKGTNATLEKILELCKELSRRVDVLERKVMELEAHNNTDSEWE